MTNSSYIHKFLAPTPHAPFGARAEHGNAATTLTLYLMPRTRWVKRKDKPWLL